MERQGYPMIVIPLLVLMVVIVAVAIVTSRAGHPAPATPPLRDQLNRWVTAGLLGCRPGGCYRGPRGVARSRCRPRCHSGLHSVLPTSPPQAGATPPPQRLCRPRRDPTRRWAPWSRRSATCGGVLAVSGVVLLVAHYWDDLAIVGQLALSGVTAVTLAGSGAAVPESWAPAMARLRAFLWTLSTAAVAVFAATAAREVLGTPPVGPVVATTAAAVAVTSGLMWWGRRRPVQQLLALAAGVISVGVGANEVIGKTGAGLAVWMIGAALVVLGNPPRHDGSGARCDRRSVGLRCRQHRHGRRGSGHRTAVRGAIGGGAGDPRAPAAAHRRRSVDPGALRRGWDHDAAVAPSP
ncbi:MAG: hypothetical protein M5U19_16425, partial [Microthrixaceae bacterium]|nr:hypothetical protein [Microthrixaceae bacterium]